MRAITLASLAFALVFGATTSAHAQPNVDAQVRNSYLALSAFECSVVATDPKEQERLFLVGLKAGREFIDFARRNPDVYKTSLRSEVAMLWNLKSGPSTDFTLGRIYEHRLREMYKDFSPDEKLWELRRDAMYREKNCQFVGTK